MGSQLQKAPRGGARQAGRRRTRTEASPRSPGLSPVRELYTPEDLPRRAIRRGRHDPIGRPWHIPVPRAASTSRCTAGACGRCAQFRPASAPARRPTSAFFYATCSTTARRDCRTAFDMAVADGPTDSDHTRSLGEVGARGRRPSTRSTTCRRCFGSIDLGEVSVSMTINAPRRDHARLLRRPPAEAGTGAARARRPPSACSGTIQADISKEYIAQKGVVLSRSTRRCVLWRRHDRSGARGACRAGTPISILRLPQIREGRLRTAQQELAFHASRMGLNVPSEQAVAARARRGTSVPAPRPVVLLQTRQIDFFEEIAKYPARRDASGARRASKSPSGAKNPALLWQMRFSHADRPAFSLTAQQAAQQQHHPHDRRGAPPGVGPRAARSRCTPTPTTRPLAPFAQPREGGSRSRWRTQQG